MLNLDRKGASSIISRHLEGSTDRLVSSQIDKIYRKYSTLTARAHQLSNYPILKVLLMQYFPKLTKYLDNAQPWPRVCTNFDISVTSRFMKVSTLGARMFQKSLFEVLKCDESGTFGRPTRDFNVSLVGFNKVLNLFCTRKYLELNKARVRAYLVACEI